MSKEPNSSNPCPGWKYIGNNNVCGNCGQIAENHNSPKSYVNPIDSMSTPMSTNWWKAMAPPGLQGVKDTFSSPKAAKRNETTTESLQAEKDVTKETKPADSPDTTPNSTDTEAELYHILEDCIYEFLQLKQGNITRAIARIQALGGGEQNDVK